MHSSGSKIHIIFTIYETRRHCRLWHNISTIYETRRQRRHVRFRWQIYHSTDQYIWVSANTSLEKNIVFFLVDGNKQINQVHFQLTFYQYDDIYRILLISNQSQLTLFNRTVEGSFLHNLSIIFVTFAVVSTSTRSLVPYKIDRSLEPVDFPEGTHVLLYLTCLLRGFY